MGAGIAQRAAQSGFRVALRDIEDRFVQGGLENIRRTLELSEVVPGMKEPRLD